MATSKEGLLVRWRTAAAALAGAPSTEQLPEGLEGVEPLAMHMEELLKAQAFKLLNVYDGIGGMPDSVDRDLLQTRLHDLAHISMGKFYAYRYDLLPYYWRQLYSDTMILTSQLELFDALSTHDKIQEDTLDSIVDMLDRALITAGGAGKLLGKTWIEESLELLNSSWSDSQLRPNKRAKTCFSTERSSAAPRPTRPCPRHTAWSIDKFEAYMNDKQTQPRPIVFSDLTKATWPALNDHPWSSPDYLLSKTFGGRRLVPVEVGRSYVDEGWGQELIPFKDFIFKYVDDEAREIGYLAQHNLFAQIPSLRNDICVPDLCWADVPGHPCDESKNQRTLDVPQLNAWFGPAGTITPLHTDGYHNVLAQVVGAKYVRLYPPWAGEAMRPRETEHGVDMSNTSTLDIGVIEGWDAKPEEMGEADLEEIRRGMEGIEYWDCVLEEGDSLVIPIGWWHYVRSLSVSFSVSFWWN